MHIAEGFLPAAHCAAWFAASTPFVVHGGRAVVTSVREHPENRLLLAAAGAFTFILSAIKLPSVSGSSSHPTGTGLGVVLFRPPVMAFLCTVVLIFQALLLAHGGISTLGANVFSMGIVGPWAGYLMWRLLRNFNNDLAAFGAFAIADLATYCMTSVQLAIAHPDVTSGYVGALSKFLSLFAITQIPLAIAEGIVGVLVLRLLTSVAAPELRRLGVLPAQDNTQTSADLPAESMPGTPAEATEAAEVSEGQVTR